MYKLDLPVDMKETAAIQRRRNAELQRQSRIFNARVRTIGVDLDGLKNQAAERKEREETERQREEAFANQTNRNDKICVLLEKRQENDIRELNKSLNDYRKTFQRKEDTREFDLNDPDQLKNDKPARISDDDPRLGISSLQKFSGEDLNSKERKQLQQEQVREWCKQQMNERSQEEANNSQANRLYDLKARELDQRAVELAESERQCREAINLATAKYNAALARETKAKNELIKTQEQDDNFTEMSNHIFGDILTENPDVAQSAFGPHRVIPDRWKGMSPAQVNEIRKTQHDQMLEKQRLEEEEKRRQEEWERLQLAQAKAGILAEREQGRVKKQLNKQLIDENTRLASEQRIYQNHLNKEVYTNPPTADFFMQFNTSSR
ncbi:RIB43A-like with coiled-coils protein 2 [Dendronephthya gigantea]|uniref:RIB43A-like with coiled-coils protein 2 n=1 Tax=Dendronephthya gigantea TaxID=151771 RepID=UPI00106B42B8|nr:RIB43A-like with coiled-coils protein 2 [Dendronephthya gigantea]XP_028415596.1 RIB43A-like with coiled-coils protein 2 [Dendronephthya gigantea]